MADPLARLADGVPAGLGSIDADGVIVAANAMLLDWFDRPAAEVVGRARLAGLLAGGSLLYFQTHLIPMLRLNGRLDEMALRLSPASGGACDVLFSARAGAEGRADFVLLPSQNRRRFEREQAEALAAAEERAAWLRHVERLGGVGAWSITAQGPVREWSDMAHALDDLPQGELRDFGEVLDSVIDPAARQEVARLIERALETGEPFSVEILCRAAKGRLKRFRVRAEAEWRRGRIDRLVGIIADMTEQRAAEAARDAAEARVLTLADNLPGMLLSLEFGAADEPAVVEFVSPRSVDLFGYTAEDIAAEPKLLSALPGHGGEDPVTMLRAAAAEGRLTRRFPVATRGGPARWVEMRARVGLVGPDRHRADCIYLDITAEVTAQAELSRQTAIATEAQKLESLGQLTGGIAHDFNNLLAVVIGNLELLSQEVAEPGARAMVDAAIGAAGRGAGLTRSLLAVARRAPLAPRVLDLNVVVRETGAWAGRTLPAGCAIETRLAEGACRVVADADSTASALLNLIVNARDAMTGGGRIVIGTEAVTLAAAEGDDLPAGRYAVLSVADSGRGIEPQTLGRIFEPFFTTKPPGEGSGLGLAMVRGFLHQSGGAVRVTSRPGQGAIFRLYFPAVDDAAEPPPGPDPAASVGAGAGRILLVDDEAAVRSVLAELLARAGHEVRQAGSPAEAEAIFAADPGFDLLLTDVTMPQGGGPALAATLRRTRPDLPVVYLTGFAALSTGGDGSAGADETILAKPVRRADLLAAVAAALAARPDGAAPRPEAETKEWT